MSEVQASLHHNQLSHLNLSARSLDPFIHRKWNRQQQSVFHSSCEHYSVFLFISSPLLHSLLTWTCYFLPLAFIALRWPSELSGANLLPVGTAVTYISSSRFVSPLLISSRLSPSSSYLPFDSPDQLTYWLTDTGREQSQSSPGTTHCDCLHCIKSSIATKSTFRFVDTRRHRRCCWKRRFLSSSTSPQRLAMELVLLLTKRPFSYTVYMSHCDYP